MCVYQWGFCLLLSDEKKNSMGQHLRWIMPDRMLPQTKEMHFLELCRKEEGKTTFCAMSLLLSAFCSFFFNSITVQVLLEHSFQSTRLSLVCQLFILCFEQLKPLLCSRYLLPKSCPPPFIFFFFVVQCSVLSCSQLWHSFFFFRVPAVSLWKEKKVSEKHFEWCHPASVSCEVVMPFVEFSLWSFQ